MHAACEWIVSGLSSHPRHWPWLAGQSTPSGVGAQIRSIWRSLRHWPLSKRESWRPQSKGDQRPLGARNSVRIFECGVLRNISLSKGPVTVNSSKVTDWRIDCGRVWKTEWSAADCEAGARAWRGDWWEAARPQLWQSRFGGQPSS